MFSLLPPSAATHSNFASLSSHGMSKKIGLLKLTGIEIAPSTASAAQNASFNKVFDLTSGGHLALVDCHVHDLLFELRTGDRPKGIITTRDRLLIQNSTFESNRMVALDKGLLLSHVIADCYYCTIERSIFSHNTLDGRDLWGGLFLIWNATFSNSTFTRSSATLSNSGLGLVIATYPWSSSLSIMSCLFESNKFEEGDATLTMGAAVFARPYALAINISDTTFISNYADAGASIAIANASGTNNWPLRQDDTPPRSHRSVLLDLERLSFADSQASALGIGAAILVQGIVKISIEELPSDVNIESLRMVDITIVNSTTPEFASLPSIGSQLILPASIIDVSYASSVSMMGINIHASDLVTNSIDLVASARVRVRLCYDFSITNATYYGMPNLGNGGYLLIQSVASSRIQNLHLVPPHSTSQQSSHSSKSALHDRSRRMDMKSSLQVFLEASQERRSKFARSAHKDDSATLASWSMVHIEKYPQAGWQKFKTEIDGMHLSEWHLPSTTAIVARSLDAFTLSHANFTDITAASNSLPLILLNAIGHSINITDSSFMRMASLASIMSAGDRITLSNIDMVQLESQDTALIAIQSTHEALLLVREMHVHRSSGPVIALHTGSTFSKIEDSTFDDITASYGKTGGVLSVGRPSADRSANPLHTCTLERSRFTSNSAASGSVLASNVPIQLYVADSTFMNNNAYTSGGVFYSEALTRLTIIRSTFFANYATDNGGVALAPFDSIDASDSTFDANAAFNGDGGAVVILQAFNRSTTPPEASFHAKDVNINTSSSDLSRKLLFTRCNFTRNTATEGGGAIAYEASRTLPLEVVDSVFLENVASDRAASFLDGQGGAISSNSPLLLSNVILQANMASGFGGALHLSPMSPSGVKLNNVAFTNNTAKNGGAVANRNADYEKGTTWDVDWHNVRFSQNSAVNSGGALFSYQSPNFLDSSSIGFENNKASQGAALYINQAPREIEFGRNFSFISNEATCCGAIVFYQYISSHDNKPQFHPLAINNTAPWGVARGTAVLAVTVSLLPGSPRFPDFIANNISGLSQTSYVTYPGVSRTVIIRGSDEFGQTVLLSSKVLDLYATFRCSSDASACANLNFESSSVGLDAITPESGLSDPTIVGGLRFSLSTYPGYRLTPGSFINGTIDIHGTDGLYDVHSIKLNISLVYCGAGYQEKVLDRDASPDGNPEAYVCDLCPLYHFSLNGTCARCAYDIGVQSCSGDSIISPPTWWVVRDPKVNRYQSVRCSESFCGTGNQCLLGRTGTMCGTCIPGRSQSITPICVDCNKPNWPLIVLGFAGIWIAALILHSMVAVSSGKSTILLFFIDSAWTIRGQIPYVSSSTDTLFEGDSTLSKVLSWFLCLWPMDYIERKLIIAMIPFVMMAQLTITFAIYHGLKRLLYFLRRTPPQKQSAEAESSLWLEAVLIGDESADSINKLSSKASPIENLDSFDELTDAVSHHRAVLESTLSSEELASTGFLTEIENEGLNPLLADFEAEPVATLDDENYSAQLFQDHYSSQVQSAYFHHYRYIRTILSLLASSFSSVLGVVLSTTGCIKLITGENLLANSPSITCEGTPLQRSLFYFGIPWLVIVAGIILVKLLHGHFTRSLSATDVRFGVWYEMYKTGFFAWKLTEFVRRAVILFIANRFIAERAIRASALSSVLIGSLGVQLIAFPYKQPLENALETISLITLCLISVLVYWYARIEPEARWASTTSFVLFILVTAVIVLGFASSVINRKLDERRRKRKEIASDALVEDELLQS